MKSISEFFAKVQGRQMKELLARQSVQEALKKAISADVPIEDISLKSYDLRIRGLSQSAKTAVYIKKAAILKEANERLAPRVIRDVRFEG